METKKEQSNSKSKQGIKNMQNGAVSFSGGIIGGMTGSAINQQEEMEERVESAPSEQDERKRLQQTLYQRLKLLKKLNLRITTQ